MLGALTVSLLFITSTLDGFQALDAAGRPEAGATLTFWRAGTTAKLAVYRDQALTVEHPNPLTANAEGRFPLIYLQDANYRVLLHAANGVLRWDIDPYVCDCTDPPYVFRTPVHQAQDEDGEVLPGAMLTFSETETETPVDTYADAAKKVPHPNPLRADAGGFFPPVYIDHDTTYRVRLGHDGEEVIDIDPYICSCGFLLLTSRPYPLELAESLDIDGALRKGGFPPTLFESVDIRGGILSGVLRVLLLSYDNYAPESIDIGGTILSGTLASKLKNYENYAPEDMDIAGSIVSGTISSKLQTYGNYAPEDVDIAGTILSGTLISDSAYANAVLDDSPVAYWRLGEQSLAQTLKDQTGSFNGTWNSGTLGEPGLVGDGTSYKPGASGYGSIPNDADLHLSPPFTVELWFKDSGSGNKVLFEKDENKFSMQREASGVMKMNIGSASNHLATGSTYNDGDPHHIVFVVDGANSKIYVDGVQDTNVVNVAAIAWSTGPVYIGSRHGIVAYDGWIDEIAMYDYALSEARIIAHYEIGTGA